MHIVQLLAYSYKPVLVWFFPKVWKALVCRVGFVVSEELDCVLVKEYSISYLEDTVL